MRRSILLSLLLCAIVPTTVLARNCEKNRADVLARGRGYYKDVFMDSGVALTSRTSLPATRFLGLSMDYFASAATNKLTQRDTLRQREMFYGCEVDTNGCLLYPDGAPRYRMIYVNGGKSGAHGRSLGKEGRERLREYVAAGGSYVGTCAGAYFGSKGSVSPSGEPRNQQSYLGLWPGLSRFTGLRKSFTPLRLDRKSPLLRYFDFGGDGVVDSVRHNGGCIAYTNANHDLPAGTVPLATYVYNDTRKVAINNKLAVWGYKPSLSSGRVILCGSHPESVVQGERLEFMSAMMLYAMDGNPAPAIKGKLTPGTWREMNKRTEDKAPEYTRIGDRQYHHFEVEVPKRCRQMVVRLAGYEGEPRYDLTLCAKRGEPAFHDNTTLKNVARGAKKRLVVDKPKAGKWYVSVLCETVPTAFVGKYGTYYRGRVDVLNGAPYKITVEYK